MVPVLLEAYTGDDPPPWLAPIAARPALGIALILALVVIVGVNETWNADPGKLRPVDAKRPDDPRNLEAASRWVERYVSQRLAGSLAERVRIQLALRERSGAVLPPVHLVQRLGGADVDIPAGTPIADVFDDMHQSMLILGAPGAGKTTLLLELTRALIERGRADGPDRMVPVLVELATWTNTRHRRPPDFRSWLLAEVQEKYRIPVSVGERWLTAGRLIVLFDGLDEVDYPSRARCLHSINELQEQFSLPGVVVCCRDRDYGEIAGRLRLQGAVAVNPLRPGDVREFLRSPELAGANASVNDDPLLLELATSPLEVSILAIAHAGLPDGGAARPTTVAERRRQLFDAYLIEVLSRRWVPRPDYPPGRTLRILRVLADTAIQFNSGLTIARPDREGWERIAPTRTAWLVGALVAPAACAGFALTVVFLTAHRFGIGVAIVVWAAVAGWQRFLAGLIATPARPTGIGSVRCAVAAMAAVGYGCLLGAAAGVPLSSEGLSADPPGLSLAGTWEGWVVLVTVLLVAGYGVLEVRRVVTGDDMPKASTVATASLVAAAAGAGVLLVAPTEAVPMAFLWFLAGAAATLAIAPMGIDRHVWSGPHQAGPDRRHVVLALLPGCALPVAWLLGAPHVGPVPAAVVTFLLVAPAGVVAGGLLSGLLHNPAAALMQILTGDGAMRFRRFLRYAADWGVLVRTDQEYRFIHVLIRNHLAGSDAEALAAAIRRRQPRLKHDSEKIAQ
jgi:hypothetical protein